MTVDGPKAKNLFRQLMGVLLTVSSGTRWLLMTQTGPEQVQQNG
jgi:hypothetical protein